MNLIGSLCGLRALRAEILIRYLNVHQWPVLLRPVDVRVLHCAGAVQPGYGGFDGVGRRKLDQQHIAFGHAIKPGN